MIERDPNANYLLLLVQKLAEEKAKLLDDQLKTVMEHAPVMVYAIDMNGTFTLYTGTNTWIVRRH